MLRLMKIVGLLLLPFLWSCQHKNMKVNYLCLTILVLIFCNSCNFEPEPKQTNKKVFWVKLRSYISSMRNMYSYPISCVLLTKEEGIFLV